MKGITLCGECGCYDLKKHRCKRGATKDTTPPGSFYADCPLDDVVPVRHGRWIEKPYLLGTTRFCGECGENFGMPHGVFKFCPNCGSRMDEGAEK